METNGSQTRARPVAAAGIAAGLALLATAPVGADAQEIAPPPGGSPVGDAPAGPTGAKVIVEFEGGLVGQGMAKVITSFGQDAGVLPTRLHRPDQTVGLCGVLNQELSVPPDFCTKDLLDAVVSLNRQAGQKVDPDRITAAEGVLLPDVVTGESAVVRLYNQSRPDEAKEIEQRKSNPGWSPSILGIDNDVLAKNGTGTGAPQIDALTVKRFSWTFEVPGEEAGIAAGYYGLGLNGPNLSVSVESNFETEAIKPFFSYPADVHFRNWCENGGTAAPKPEGVYADMVSSLYETKDAVACTGTTSVRPEVAIMDQPITVNPDFKASFSDDATDNGLPAQAPVCKLRLFKSNTDHGNLLASIVAAGANGYGFAGLAPEARIRPFDFGDVTTNQDLKAFIEKTDQLHGNPVPRVFLFASVFDPAVPFPRGALSSTVAAAAKRYWRWNDQENAFELMLADENARMAGPLVREILTRKFLLVAAAGQPQDATGTGLPEGREIDWERPWSPQNLGDDDNVLVVGACVNCAGDQATLWTSSNRGKRNSAFVSVLAPGGVDVPAYVSESEVATTVGGTSSAAAFVAGLAARMTACHPNPYVNQPENLKARIILASRPTFDEKIRRTVVGGVVDPAVSMLDPNKDWLKLTASAVRPVTFHHWCSKALEADGDEIIALKRTHRLTSLDGALVRQTVYDEADDASIHVVRVVRREAPRTPIQKDAPVAAVSGTDGNRCAVLGTRLQDLFLGSETAERAGVNTCEAIPPCE